MNDTVAVTLSNELVPATAPPGPDRLITGVADVGTTDNRADGCTDVATPDAPDDGDVETTDGVTAPWL